MMKLVQNAWVNRNGAYHQSGGLIDGTQRMPMHHTMEYWQQGNLENQLAIKTDGIPFKVQAAIYVGRIPTHFGHFIMEGLPRLWYPAIMDLPIIGYITDGYLPEGIVSTPMDDIRWAVKSVTNEEFHEVGEDDIYQVEKLIVPSLPIHLSLSCSEPWNMTSLINKIVAAARMENGSNPIDSLYLARYEELNEEVGYPMSNPKASLSEQIAMVSNAQRLYGKTGSNTHVSIFAGHSCETFWRPSGDYQQGVRNQLICDIVRTFNKH